MELTKRRLKEIIAEEMNNLAETGDLNMITESEKKAFAIILEKLTPTQLEELGLARVPSREVVSEATIKIPEKIAAMAKTDFAAAKRAMRRELKKQLEAEVMRPSERASQLNTMMRSATASLKRLSGN